MPDSKWLSVKVDERHYHYVCKHCKAVSKYRKTPYCPMCGYVMLNSNIFYSTGKRAAANFIEGLKGSMNN